MFDPLTCRSAWMAGYVMSLGFRPVSVTLLPPNPWRKGRRQVEWRFQGQAAADALAEYARGSESDTMVPVRRLQLAVEEAFKMQRDARNATSPWGEEPSTDDYPRN